MSEEKKIEEPEMAAPNRAKRRKDAGAQQSGLRQRVRRFKGVAIPRDQQPWANENRRNNER